MHNSDTETTEEELIEVTSIIITGCINPRKPYGFGNGLHITINYYVITGNTYAICEKTFPLPEYVAKHFQTNKYIMNANIPINIEFSGDVFKQIIDGIVHTIECYLIVDNLKSEILTSVKISMYISFSFNVQSDYYIFQEYRLKCENGFGVMDDSRSFVLSN